jgi:hypothetical protein
MGLKEQIARTQELVKMAAEAVAEANARAEHLRQMTHELCQALPTTYSNGKPCDEDGE